MDSDHGDHYHFRFSLRIPEAQSSISDAMADTGCHSCLANLENLVVSTKDLIPVSMKMQTVSNDNICILVPLYEVVRKKPYCIPPDNRKHRDILFLSSEACVDIGNIPNSFPAIGETEEQKLPTTSVL